MHGEDSLLAGRKTSIPEPDGMMAGRNRGGGECSARVVTSMIALCMSIAAIACLPSSLKDTPRTHSIERGHLLQRGRPPTHEALASLPPSGGIILHRPLVLRGGDGGFPDKGGNGTSHGPDAKCLATMQKTLEEILEPGDDADDDDRCV